MRIKTIIIILITVLLTIVLMQNTGRISLNFLWATFFMPKLFMLFLVAAVGFILGLMVGRPKRVPKLGGDLTDIDLEKRNPNTLSDEDREYIS